MTVDWSSSADWDGGQSDGGDTSGAGFVHHEQPTGTDWSGADVVEKGYPSSDQGGSDLVAYWPLDEDSGSTANDVTSNANDGTITGATTGVAAVLGTTGYSFAAAGDEVAVPNDASLNFTGNFSVSFWLNFDGISNTGGGNQGIISKAGDASDGYSVGLLNSSFNFYTRIDGTADSLGAGPTSGSWHHYLIAHDSTAAETDVYEDGTLLNTVTSAPTLTTTNTGSLYLGHNSWNEDDFFPGDLSDVRLYSRHLSATEATNLYQTGV